MAKKMSITGIIEIPSETADLVLDENSAEFRRTKNYQFHKKDNCYVTQACVKYDGKDYVIAQQLGSSNLSICYLGKNSAPDMKTQRQIRRIVSEKFFWKTLLSKPKRSQFLLGLFILLAFNTYLYKISF